MGWVDSLSLSFILFPFLFPSFMLPFTLSGLAFVSAFTKHRTFPRALTVLFSSVTRPADFSSSPKVVKSAIARDHQSVDSIPLWAQLKILCGLQAGGRGGSVSSETMALSQHLYILDGTAWAMCKSLGSASWLPRSSSTSQFVQRYVVW